MPDTRPILNKRAIIFAVLAFIFFCSIFIFAPLGNFFIWIFIGCLLYSVFYSVYNLMLKSKAGPASKRLSRKETEQQRSIREHIQYHVPILVSLFLAALLLVITFLFFFT